MCGAVCSMPRPLGNANKAGVSWSSEGDPELAFLCERSDTFDRSITGRHQRCGRHRTHNPGDHRSDHWHGRFNLVRGAVGTLIAIFLILAAASAIATALLWAAMPETIPAKYLD